VPKARDAAAASSRQHPTPDFNTGSSVDPLAAAFIAETPVDEPRDEERNVRVRRSLVESA
jgi:hypothetical protein